MTISDERLAEMRKSLENHGGAKMASIYTSDYLDAITELQSLRRSSSRGGVKVKGLEWDGQKAKNSLTLYEVSKTPLGWIWTALIGSGIASRHSFPNEEEAKAAAQADYERRILSAIEQEQEPVAWRWKHPLWPNQHYQYGTHDPRIGTDDGVDCEPLFLSPSVCEGKVTAEEAPLMMRLIARAEALIGFADLKEPEAQIEWVKWRDIKAQAFREATAALSQEGE